MLIKKRRSSKTLWQERRRGGRTNLRAVDYAAQPARGKSPGCAVRSRVLSWASACRRMTASAGRRAFVRDVLGTDDRRTRR